MNKYMFVSSNLSLYDNPTIMLINAKCPERALYLMYDYNGGMMAKETFEKIANSQELNLSEKMKIFEQNTDETIYYFGLQYSGDSFSNKLDMIGDAYD
jgi:hypothetical protein